MQAVQRRQLLPRGGLGRAAVPRRLVLERGESDELGRVRGVPGWFRLRDGVDGSRAVRSGHVHIDHTPIRVRDVRRGRVSGRIGLDGLQGLPGRLVLPSRRIGAAAVLGGHLLEQPESAQRRRLYSVPRRLELQHRLDIEYAVLAWHLHGHHGPIRVPRVHGGQLPGRERLDGVQDLWRRQLLPSRRVGRAAVPGWHLLEQHRSGGRP